MAFIGLSIPETVSKKLSKIKVPGDKENPEDYHITLIHFEEKHSPKEILKIIEIVSEITSKIKPFDIKTAKLTSFPKFEDNPIPIIVKVESRELHKLQEKLKNKLIEENIEFSKTFKEFKPHITLSYLEAETFKDKNIEELVMEMKELTYFGGEYKNNYLKVDFKLGHGNQSLKKKAEMFEGLAKS